MCITCANAQEINNSQNVYTKDYKKNSVFFETKSYLVFGGFTGFGYERLFPIKENLKITTELSFSIVYLDGAYTNIAIPHITLLLGNEQNFELGGGCGFGFGYMKDYSVMDYSMAFRVGYRYQRKGGGLYFRAALVPWMWINAGYFDFLPLGSFAFGYSF